MQDNPCDSLVFVVKALPRYFVSHNWAEPFRDFMHSIEMHAKHVCARIHDIYFVCTFANDQWHLDLGDQLATCPFYLALMDASNVVLFASLSLIVFYSRCMFLA